MARYDQIKKNKESGLKVYNAEIPQFNYLLHVVMMILQLLATS